MTENTSTALERTLFNSIVIAANDTRKLLMHQLIVSCVSAVRVVLRRRAMERH